MMHNYMRNRFIALLIRFNGSELALCGLVIIVRAIGPNVQGFIPRRRRWIFGGEVMASVAFRQVLQHVKKRCGV
jgi:hypothetical protein